nr:iron-containing alcohol dehydrogenase [uncultured Paraglaciecola sp.]
MVLKNHCDGVLAFGGGSSIDAAKAIAACVTNTKTAQQLAGVFKVKQAILPLYAIPTTAGTGSEVTPAAVISNSESHKKEVIIDPKLTPRMAALDCNLMLELPPAITAATGVDALTHAIEAYISTNATDHTNELALSAIKLIFKLLETAVTNGKNVQARQSMAMASYYAGMAFSRAGLGYVHAISHNIGAKYAVPHGIANAIILPQVLDFSLPNIEDKLANLARLTNIVDNGVSDKNAAKTFIAAVRQMIKSMGIPHYFENLEAKDIPELARSALKEAHFTPYAVPKYLDQMGCENLISKMMKA